jgi:hypothetical protein
MSCERYVPCLLRVILIGTFVTAPWFVSGSLAQPYDYHPLDIGSHWYYENQVGDWQSMTIVGEEEVLGTVTRVRRQELAAEIFENFWTRDESGNLFIHGARNLTYTFEVAYLPPVRMVDAPLYLGKNWITENIVLYDLEGNPLGDSLDYPLQVYFEGDIEVPAGQFYAYGVGQVIYPPILRNAQGERFDLLGRHLKEADPTEREQATEWYVDGVGLAQHTYLVPPETWWRLQWWNQPTPAAPVTWGAIKALYRE